MGRKIDVEYFIDTIVSILKTSLPAKITELNLEFSSDGHGITLVAVPNANYFMGGLPDDVNVDPWIVVHLFGEVEATSQGSSVRKSVTAFISFGGSAFIMDTSEKITRTFLRYMRAIEECIAASFAKIHSTSALQITQIPSIQAESDAGEVIRTDPGVLVKATFI